VAAGARRQGLNLEGCWILPSGFVVELLEPTRSSIDAYERAVKAADDAMDELLRARPFED
jgi:hypothetical protein